MRIPKLIPAAAHEKTDEPSPVQHTVVMQDRLRKALCLMATETWRLQRKLGRLTTESLDDELAGMSTSVNRMESGLREIGVECREYTNQPYDPGMNLTVLAYEDVEGTSNDRAIILHTVAPSVFFLGQLIQQGEVVVASNRGERDGDG